MHCDRVSVDGMKAADTKHVSTRADRVAVDELVGTNEAARTIGCSPCTLRRLALAGYVPSLKLSQASNSHRYFLRGHIEALARGGYHALQSLLDRNGD